MKTKVIVTFLTRYTFFMESDDEPKSFIKAQQKVHETTPAEWIDKYGATKEECLYPSFAFEQDRQQP